MVHIAVINKVVSGITNGELHIICSQVLNAEW